MCPAVDQYARESIASALLPAPSQLRLFNRTTFAHELFNLVMLCPRYYRSVPQVKDAVSLQTLKFFSLWPRSIEVI